MASHQQGCYADLRDNSKCVARADDTLEQRDRILGPSLRLVQVRWVVYRSDVTNTSLVLG